MFRTDFDFELPTYSISSMWESFKSHLPFHDAYQLYMNGGAYIMNEGYKRSKATGVGVIDPLPFGDIARNLPLVSWVASNLIPRIYVFSATSNNQSSVGNLGENMDDPHAREPYDRVIKATGATTIVNLFGQRAAAEKIKIRKNLNNDLAFQYAQELGGTISHYWDNSLSLQDNITYVGANIIGKCFLGINNYPKKYVSLIRKANDLIAEGKSNSTEFSKLRKDMLDMNNDILGNDARDIIESNGYARAQITLSGQETLEEEKEILKASLSAGGFLVESNLSFILMLALAHVSSSPDILEALLDEIKEKDIQSPADLKDLHYLDCIYRETLRFGSPTAVVPRATSVGLSLPVENAGGKTSECYIYPNSYLFFAIRPTHHDPALWRDPHLFNPLRFIKEAEENHIHFNGKHFFPFSAGKRACPAGVKFVEYAFKGFLIEFFKRYHLTLDKSLESIPANATHPRWQNDYYATLSEHSKRLVKDKAPLH